MVEDRKSAKEDDLMDKPIQGSKMWEALKRTLDVFGPTMKGATIAELERNGLALEGDPNEYTLTQLGEKFQVIFGKDGTEVIIEQVARNLHARNSHHDAR
jgi:hypothetical protein